MRTETTNKMISYKVNKTPQGTLYRRLHLSPMLTIILTMTVDLQNEWRCRRCQEVTMYQVWSKYFQPFCRQRANRHTDALPMTRLPCG